MTRPTRVLHGVDLLVRQRELLAIVGPSGSGKSTLLNIIGTLDRPTSGDVCIAGYEVDKLADKQLSALRAREIGFVFQQFFLLPGMSALDNVSDGLLYTGRGLRDRRARAREALERVGLGHRLDYDTEKLSGGERQRVAIARALVGQPTVVLADEPTGNLDTRSGDAIVSLLHELNHDGSTIVVITHDHDIAGSLPRQVAVRDGLIESDTTSRHSSSSRRARAGRAVSDQWAPFSPRAPSRQAAVPSSRPVDCIPATSSVWHLLACAAVALRTSLSALGIAIGIAAMVAVLGISESSKSHLLAALDKLGTNLLVVEPGGGFVGNEDAVLPITSETMLRRIAPVEEVSSVTSVDASVLRTDLAPSNQTGGITVKAADTQLLDTLVGEMADGEWLDDARTSLPVVVLGSVAAERLGITDVSDGVQVWLGEQWFAVIGIMAPFELAPDLDTSAIVGRDIATAELGAAETPGTVYLRTDPDKVDDVEAVIAPTANPDNPDQVEASRPSDAIEARAAASNAFTALFLGLGAVALLVGGVGIANVMVISVLERRSEIGLRRALGATRRHVSVQFLSEASAAFDGRGSRRGPARCGRHRRLRHGARAGRSSYLPPAWAAASRRH